MTLVTKAQFFAIGAHEAIQHRRKYTNEPYWYHLKEVASIVENTGVLNKYSYGYDLVAASWLHDVVEDTPVTLEILREHFPVTVVWLVEHLTDVSKPSDGNRKVRKALDREHTAAAPPEAKTIKLADLISNTRSIVGHDPDGFAPTYMEEKWLLLPFLKEGDKGLFEQANKLVEDYFNDRSR